MMRTRRAERSTMACIEFVGRRKTKSLLGELCSGGRRAAISGEFRCVVEHTGDHGIRRVGRKREVTGAEKRIFDEFGDARVNAPPLLAKVVVEDRRQQRVGEADRSVVALDHVRNDCCVERVWDNTRPLQKSLRRRAQRRGQTERLPRGRGKSGEPCAHEIFERRGNCERLNRATFYGESAGQLQREERIPARPLVDAKQCLACEVPVEAVV
jgi:hypothetical protein